MNMYSKSQPSDARVPTELDPADGYTILEMMMVILIMAVLGRSAVSMTSATLDAADKSTAEVQVVQDLRRAQATAVTEGCRGIVFLAPAGTYYSFGCDYLPYDTAATPVADTTLFTSWLPQGITISSNAQIIFNSRGQSEDAAYDLATRTLTLTSTQGLTPVNFATGTLRATGFFSYN